MKQVAIIMVGIQSNFLGLVIEFSDNSFGFNFYDMGCIE